ncbi:peptidoglycan editing factor PgeF [Pallidibacillus pasinlerensis]|uniref:Purine nucleoside phosphorylase n=1 Tax=Pallidibacillus pasinlerensis TaxID=2703818 RepID=A0ABW9ZYF3_9BACI|nr:peptidoglycan editing factor PgeF [Pallidibacillus pasinlerensis]NCU16204.1 peptidoglycan editing factor PgeF [Pallidibacillus pasinlerensis]
MTEPFLLKDPTFFVIEEWQKLNPRIIAGFTTKNNGFSLSHYKSNNLGLHVGDDSHTVVKNREKLADQIQIPLNQWVCLQQTHGNNVQYVNQEHWGSGALDFETSIKDCDGIYTNQPGTLLGLMYADCVPIYFYAPQEQMVGIVHAGWKGTVKKIVQSLLNDWQHKGIDLSSVYACIGPSICEHCYIVDDRVINEVKIMNLSHHERFYNEIKPNQYKLDLKGLNKALLTQIGLRENQIQLTSLCTSCENSQFYSHRRDQGKTGRMMGFIGIKEKED